MLAGAMEHAWAFCTQLHSFPQQNKKQFCMKPWCVSDVDQISWYFSESNSTYCEWCSVPGSEISSALCQYLHTPRFFDILHCVLLCTWGHYLLHISFLSPACMFFGTRFAGHYCVNLTLCTHWCCWFTSWFATQWTAKQLKDVSLPKIPECLPSRLYFF